MSIASVQFLALLFTALSLVPSGAHLAAMANKMRLAEADYFVVQGIYAGWAVLGLLWLAAMIALAALAYLSRPQPAAAGFALTALACYAVTLAIFFVWTFPANQATANWTVVPENWETLRLNWEYSHAANAVIVLLAFVFTVLSTLSWRQSAMPTL